MLQEKAKHICVSVKAENLCTEICISAQACAVHTAVLISALNEQNIAHKECAYVMVFESG